nr:protein rep [uncultured Psychroserpens sp.]
MRNQNIPHLNKSIYTLGQNRTANSKIKSQLIQISGTGTDLIDNSALIKRANKKVITNALVLALVDIAKKDNDERWEKKYWNTFHCQKKFVEYNDKLYTKYCGNRWCATCCGIRKAELLNKYYSTLIEWSEPHLLTLTLKTVKANKLKSRINEMIKSFNRINDRCKKRHIRNNAMKIMGVKSLECNFNAQRCWYNPHYHIITPNRQTALYLKQEWKKEWNKNSFNASDKAQDIRVIESVEKGLVEVIKYGAKMLSEPDPNYKYKRSKGNLEGLSIYARGLHNIYDAFDSRQLFKSFGFQLPQEIVNTSSTQVISKYDVYQYRVKDMDWVNTDTGEFLTEYEIDNNLNYLLKTSIDTILY